MSYMWDKRKVSMWLYVPWRKGERIEMVEDEDSKSINRIRHNNTVDNKCVLLYNNTIRTVCLGT